ncbi:hypothetical protein MXB_5613, partial [Myxobolus squamalis]
NTFLRPVPKKILIYGTFYGETLLKEIDVNLCRYYQPYEITRSNTIENIDFDVVMLHFDHQRRFMSEYLSMKPLKKKNMIVFAMEPPHSVRNSFDYQLSKDYFNHWAFNYMPSSFFFGPYGDYTEKNNLNYSLSEIKEQFRVRKNASFSVISNCGNVKSLRLDYIEELQKIFNVETYGACFGSKISKEDRMEKMLTYKFFIAAENSHCADYSTEKYWDAIYTGSIPIVIGHPTNLTTLIPGSFINAFNFSHPKYLAKYLEKVISHENEFIKYHEWREKYTVRYFPVDCCKILDTITSLLDQGNIEDPTIHLIDSEYLVCIPPQLAYNMLVK